MSASALRRVAIVLLALSTIMPMMPAQALHTTTLPKAPQVPPDETPDEPPETGFTDPDQRIQDLYTQHRAAIEGLNRELKAQWGTLEDPPVAKSVQLFEDAFASGTRAGGLGNWTTIDGSPDPNPNWKWQPPSKVIDPFQGNVTDSWRVLPAGEATGSSWGEDDDLPGPLSETSGALAANESGDEAAMAFTTPGERGYPTGTDTVLLSPVIDLSSLGQLRNNIPRGRGGDDVGSEIDSTYHLFYLFLEHRFSFARDQVAGGLDGARVEVYPAEVTPGERGKPIAPHSSIQPAQPHRGPEGQPGAYSASYGRAAAFAETNYDSDAAFTGTSDWRVDVFNLTAWAGMKIRLGFHVNTLNFQEEEDLDEEANPGWFIDRAEVRAPGLPGQIRVGNLLSPDVDRFDVGVSEPAPGQVTYRVPVWSLGSTTEDVEIDWTIQRNGSRGPFSDTLAEGTETVQLGPGEVHVLQATAHVPKIEEDSRQVVWLNLSARPQGQGSSMQQAEGIAQSDPGQGAFPVWVHDVDALKPQVQVTPGSAPPGVTRHVNLSLENRGNVPETVNVTLHAFEIPEDKDAALVPANRWFDDDPSFNVTIEPGERLDEKVALTIPEVTDARIRARLSWWNNTAQERAWDNRTFDVGSGTAQDVFFEATGEAFEADGCDFPAEGEPPSQDMFFCPSGSPRAIGAVDGWIWRGNAEPFAGGNIQRSLVGYPVLEPTNATQALAGSEGFLGTRRGGPSVYQGPVTGLKDIALDIRYDAEPQKLAVRFQVRGPFSSDEKRTAANPPPAHPARSELQVIEVLLAPPDNLRDCGQCVDAFKRATWKHARIDVSKLIRENTGVNDVWRMGLEEVAIVALSSSSTVRVDYANLTGVPVDRPGEKRISILRTNGKPIPYQIQQESRPVCAFLPAGQGECHQAFRGDDGGSGGGLGDPGDHVPTEEECRELGLGDWSIVCKGAHDVLEIVEDQTGDSGPGGGSGSDEPRVPGKERVRETEEHPVVSVDPWCGFVPVGTSREGDVGRWCPERPNEDSGWKSTEASESVSDDWETVRAPWTTDEGESPSVWRLRGDNHDSANGPDSLYVTVPNPLPPMEDPRLVVRHMYEGGARAASLVHGTFGDDELVIDGSIAVFAQVLPPGCAPEDVGEVQRCAWSSKRWLQPLGGYPTPMVERSDGSRRTVLGDVRPGSGFYHPVGNQNLVGPEEWVTPFQTNGSGLRTHVFSLEEDSLGVDPSNRAIRFAVAGLDSGTLGPNKDYQFGLSYHLEELAIRDSPLDLDLEAGPVKLEASYNLDRFGAGPGTEIPVRVQVNNTGRLAVQEAELQVEVLSFEHRQTATEDQHPVCPHGEATGRQTIRTTVALGPGASTNRTLLWSVPEGTTGQWFCLTASVSAPGLEDQDPADNRFPREGRRARDLTPMQARQVADLQVRQRIAPEDAPTGVTRSAVVELRNAGNSPARDVEITRTVERLSSSILRVRSDTWELPRPLEPGSSWVRLDDPMLEAEHRAVGTDEPAFQWTPTTSGRYRLSAHIQGEGERAADLGNNRDTRFVDARDVSLEETVDDADSQGIDRRQLAGSVWQVHSGSGFRSEKSLWIGGDEDGYPDAANATLRLPSVDLSAARSAVLSFMTRYDTEAGYDGGTVQASLDRGKTWHPLEPSRVGHDQGYPAQVAGSNPVIPDGIPTRSPGAFSGRTPQDGALDGWAPVTVPLDQIPGLTRSERLSDLMPPEIDEGHLLRDGASSYRPSWVVGRSGSLERFEVYNATLAQPRPVTGETIWYSGHQDLTWLDAYSVRDPAQDRTIDIDAVHTLLNLSVDLEAVGAGGEDVRFQFWDWRDGVTPVDRRGTGGTFEVSVMDTLGNEFACQTDPEPNAFCRLEPARGPDGESVTKGDWTLRNLTITPQPTTSVSALRDTVSDAGVAETKNGQAYLFGGRNGTELRSDILHFDADNPGPPDPVPARFPGRWGSAVAWDDANQSAYVFGGQIGDRVFGGGDDAQGNLTPEILLYNRTEGDAEETGQELPGSRTGTGVVWNATTGTAYVLGGFGCTTSQDPCTEPKPLAEVHVYNASTNEVLTGEDGNQVTLETPRYGAATVWDQQAGVAYLLGGQTGDDGERRRLSSIEAFAPGNTSTWTTDLELPTPRTNASAVWAADEGVAYVFGGENGDGVLDQIVRVDPSASGDDRVEVVGHLPAPRLNTAAVWDDEENVAYIVGGVDAEGDRAANVFRFDPDDSRQPIIHVGGLPEPRMGPAAAWNETNREVVVLGGLGGWANWDSEPSRPDDKEAKNVTVPVYDAKRGRMEQDNLHLPSPRAGTSVAWTASGGRAYILGGTCPARYDNCKEGYLDEIVTVNPDVIGTEDITDRVVVEATLPSPRAATSAVWDNRDASNGGQLAYVFGGTCPETYDTCKGGYLDEVVTLDPDSTGTEDVVIDATLPSPRAGTSAVWNATATKAYVLGGETSSSGRLDEVLAFDPDGTNGSPDVSTATDKNGGDAALPRGRAYAGTAFDEALSNPGNGHSDYDQRPEDFIYLIGGQDTPRSGVRIDTRDWEADRISLTTPVRHASAVWAPGHSGDRGTGFIIGGGTSRIFQLIPRATQSLEGEIQVTFDYESSTRAEPIRQVPGPSGNRGWAIDNVSLMAGKADGSAFAEVLHSLEERATDEEGVSWEQDVINISGDRGAEHIEWSFLTSPSAYDEREKSGTARGNLTTPGGWSAVTDDQGRRVWNLSMPPEVDSFAPNMDTRLVSPVIDLSETASPNATLTLEQAYRFTNNLSALPSEPSTEDFNVEGGAIEIQVLNETTGEFGDWRTLLPRSDGLEDFELCRSGKPTAVLFGCAPQRAFIQTSSGAVPDILAERLAPYSVFARHVSPPFPPVATSMFEEQPTGYVQRETAHPALFITGTETDPRTDTFDLSAFIGDRIRIAFHAWSNPADHCAAYPDNCPTEFWQINEARVDTQVIDGQPVDLRFRFGSDQQVAGRGWGLDDIQVGVSEYARNLALRFKQSNVPETISPGQTFWVNGTIENLGTSPRTGFGVRLADQGQLDAVEVEAFNGSGFNEDPAGPFALGASGGDASSATFAFRVNATEDLTKRLDQVLDACTQSDRLKGECAMELAFELRLVEQPVEGADPVFDEATGNKAHRFDVNVSFDPRLNLSVNASSLRVEAGEPITVKPMVENIGPTPLEPVVWVNVTRGRDVVQTVDHRMYVDRGERQVATGEDFTFHLEEPGKYRVIARTGGVPVRQESSLEIHVGDAVTALGAGFEARKLDQFTTRTIGHGENCDDPRVGDRNGERKTKAGPQWRTTNATAAEGRISAVFGASPGNGSYQQLSDSALRTESLSLASLPDPRLSFAHQPLFAPGEGGVVEMRFLDATGNPKFTGGNTNECNRGETRLPNSRGWFLLLPEGGYDAETRSTPAVPPGQYQPGSDGNQNPLGDGHPVFRSEQPGWRRAAFDLLDQTFRGLPEDMNLREILEKAEVQFRLRATSRSAGATGSGWLVDSLAVTSHVISVDAGAERLPLADGARKVYTFAVDNPSRLNDAYRIAIDWQTTTLPRDMVELLTEKVEVPAGETGVARVAVELPVGTSLPRGDYKLAVRATSIAEPLVADKDQLTFGVQTVPHADLVPRLETGGTQFEVGSTATLGVVVLNAGDAESRSTKARFVVSQSDGSQREVVAEVPVPPVPPPGSREGAPQTVIATNWTVPREELGRFVVDVEVDPFDRVVELNEEDNVASRQVEVIPLQRPDLEVLPTDLELFTLSGSQATSVRPFDLVEVVGTVRNTGNQAATSTRVNVLLGASLVNQVDLGQIPAGASKTLSVNLFAPGNTTNVELVARTPEPEFTETNNEASAPLVVQQSRFETQLSSSNLTLEPETPTTTRLTLTNKGSTPRLLDFRIPGDGLEVATGSDTVLLPPGETRSTQLKLTIDDDADFGQHELLLVGHDANGERRLAVPVKATVRRVVEHHVDPQPVARAPGALSVPVTVENLGNVPDMLVLSATHDALRDSGEVSLTLDPGQTQRVLVPVTTPRGLAAGTYNLTIDVNSREGFSTSVPTTLTIEPTPRVDISSEAVREGAFPVEYALTLTNTGNVPATPYLRVIDEPAGWHPTLDVPGERLAPGERTQATLALSSTGEPSPGIVELPLSLQVTSPHAQTARANHTLRATVDVRPASLTIDNVERTPRFDVAEGDTVEYTAHLVNEGSGPAAPAHMWLYVDDELADRTTVDRLSGHSETTVNLTYTARAGEQAVVLSADPMDEIDEFNETDNDLGFTVQASSGLLGAPGVPLLFALLALLGAAAWRRRDP